MALTAEQIAEARKEGYTDAEILNHYAAQQGINLKAARDEGYSDSEILSHFSGAEVSPQVETDVPDSQNALANPMLSGALGAGAGAVYSAKTLPVKAAKAFGSAIGERLPKAAPTPAAPPTYTTPAGINVEQVPGGMHPGAVGNAQFNVEQQQANKLHQGVPEGYNVRGTSRIITPVGMEEPAAAMDVPRSKPGMGVMREAVKTAAPVVGGTMRNIATSSPVAGAIGGYNLQQAINRSRAGDTTGEVIGGVGAASQLLPKMKGKLGLVKPLVGLGAAGVNALRGEPESVMGHAAGGSITPIVQKMAGGGKADLLFQAIKSAKQLAREAGYTHDIAPTHQFSTPKQLSIQELQGKTLVGVPGDRTLTGHEVRAVNRVPLSKPVEQQGGPMYGLRQQDLGKGNFWASNDAAAIALQNKARRAQQQHGNDVFGIYTAMAPDAGNYALHTTETLLNQIPAMNPRKKDITAFDKMIRERFPSFAGVTDPDVLEQLARDSKMRKFLAERLNKTTVAEQYGMPSGEATIHAITEPALRDVPTGNTGFTIGRLHPEKELTPNIDVSHGTYNTNIPGEFQGQMIAQVPWQMYFPDAAKQIAANPKQAPHAWGTFKMGDYNQPVTQELVDRIAPLEESILSGNVPKFAKGGKLSGGLSSMPTGLRTDMRKIGQAVDEYSNADTYNKAKMLYNSPVAQGALMAGSMVNPYMALGVGGGEALRAINEGDYADAALAGGMSSAPFLGPIVRGARQIPGMIRGGLNALAPAERAMPSVMSGAVPAMAGGGDVLKALAKRIGGVEGVGARAVEGSPHTYPPIAEGPWMRDYQPAARPAPTIEYMGKYQSPTPERMAAQRAQMNQDIQTALENRKAQWLKHSREMGVSEQDIMDQMNSPWGAPWMP